MKRNHKYNHKNIHDFFNEKNCREKMMMKK